MTPPRLLVVLACTAVLAGCGGGEKVGSGVDVDAKGGPGNLFATTAPPAAKPVPTKAAVAAPKAKPAAPKAVAPAPVRTQAPQQAAAPPPPQQAAAPKPYDVDINGDKSGQALLSPPQFAVYVGTTVVWHNRDTVVRSVEAQNGGFASGKIPPGGTYTWVAGPAGQYSYHDGTRPYVNGEVQVAAP